MTRQKKKSGKGQRQQRRRLRQPLKGRRFTAAQRREAMRLVRSGIKRTEVARMLKTTVESLRRWRLAEAAAERIEAAVVREETRKRRPRPHLEASRAGTKDSSAARPEDEIAGDKDSARDQAPELSPGGLSPLEVKTILDLKKEHPSMGPAQIRAQLKRFHGWRVSIKAIAKVLVRAGYKLVRTKGRPDGQEEVTRFEAPRRNALWQMDFVELRVGPERVYILFVIDDYSRFVVGHKLAAAPSSEVAVATLQEAIALHGKCEAVYTDRGGAFLAWRDRSSFQRFLEQEQIDHHVSRAYRPQGRGKVEALIGTLQRELWQVRHFDSVAEAETALRAWVAHYNERRAHMGLDGLCPADRFFGRAEAVRALLAARIRGRALASTAQDAPGAPVEDAGEAAVEVLRLVLVDGRLELRLFGSRVALGALTP
jgi:transposase InsO family protein